MSAFYDPTGKLHFIHAKVPTPNAAFEANIPSKNELKMNRPIYQYNCEKCHRTNAGAEDAIKLSRCAKCKTVWYCSKQCQKDHWPQHKTSCHEVSDSGIHRMVQLFWTHRYLRGCLEVYCILTFDIPSPRGPARTNSMPYVIRIDIGLEPTDITPFMQMFHEQKSLALPMTGMFQINDITQSSSYDIEYFTRPPRPRSTWMTEEVEDQVTSRTGYPVVCMEFVFRGEVDKSVSMVTAITKEAMEVARKKKPYSKKSSVKGMYDIPMTPASTIESINDTIRGDKRNQLHLQFPMTPVDTEIIRAAGRHDQRYSRAVQYVLAKVTRDAIYTPVLVVL